MKLVVGVDPGTTVGWAVLDLQGNVVSVNSKKELSLDSLVSIVSQLGTPIVVGCDKAKVPAFVQDFATKFHARVVSPRSDLSRHEKRDLVAGFDTSNAHEADALASALLAYRRSEVLLRKIRANLSRAGKSGLFEDISDLVIREGISIHAALAILTPAPVEEVVSVEEQENDSDVVSLFSSLRSLRRENSVLRDRLDGLEQELSSMRSRYSSLKERSASLVRPKSAFQLSREKEERIVSLSSKLKSLRKSERRLKSKLLQLEFALLKHDVLALPYLRRLGGTLPVELADAVFVEDPNEFSMSFVDALKKGGVNLVLYGRSPSRAVRSRLPFAFFPGRDMLKDKFDTVVLVDSKKFKEACASKYVLEQVVGKYKLSRVGRT